MRILLLLGLATLVAVAAATMRPEIIQNPLSYANVKSRNFASRESGDTSGWRECAEVEGPPGEVAIACEGVRTIKINQGQRVDVNYFCEMGFEGIPGSWYRVKYVLCQ